MNRKQQIEVIHEAFDSLPDMQDGSTDARTRLAMMNTQSERQYRSGRYGNKGLSVRLAAAFFTVSHLLEAVEKQNLYSIDDILHIRTEVLYAQAYAKKFQKQLVPWATTWAGPFRQVDYVKLMQA